MTTPSTMEHGAVMPATGLTREAVLALSDRFKEPDWLRESREFVVGPRTVEAKRSFRSRRARCESLAVDSTAPD